MLGKKKSSKSGKSLPTDWVEGLSRLLNETYKTESRRHGRYFDVFGQVYTEETLLIISYLSERDEYLAPITLFLSTENTQLENINKVKEAYNNLIDLIGLFFDEIFTDDEWNEFEPNWQEIQHQGGTYYYKISRENVSASLEADKILGPDFEDLEAEED